MSIVNKLIRCNIQQGNNTMKGGKNELSKKQALHLVFGALEPGDESSPIDDAPGRRRGA